MPTQALNTNVDGRAPSLLSPTDYDADAVSIRSDQDSDSDDDQLQQRARNSRELRAHDSLVLVQEEELDQLVTDTRKRLERRGSGLPIPNPIKLFARQGSRSRSPAGNSAMQSTEDLALEEQKSKRSRRRTRRREKKERLMSDAGEGEDRALMYEMEQGGLKEGSSTGESSDTEEGHHYDGKEHLLGADPRAARKRSWRKWLLIHSIIAVAFAILILVAWKLSIESRRHAGVNQLVSNGTALFAPTTIIISLDGFRADFLQRGLTPTLNAFIKEGVSPLYMLPSFPSVTFPNHYTLATGLYPESHGVVGNTFWDPALEDEFYYTKPAQSMDPKWWLGEPFWVTAELQGIRSAIHMWPGSEAHIMGIEPSFLDKYNGKEKLPKKVNRILEFLDKPGLEDPNAPVAEMRPQIIAAYVPNVDTDGHKFGPNSTEIRTTIKNADDMLRDIFHGLEERNLTHIVNVIVVSDHGMATTDVSRMIQVDDLVDMDKIAHTDGWPLVGLRPKDPNDLQGIYEGLLEKTKAIPSIDIYLRDVDMPERYHFSNNDRIAPLWIIPKTGWAIVEKSEFDIAAAKVSGEVYHPIGLHGYDHEHPLMRAIFVARGPAFPHAPNSRLENFQNIEVYNILCDSVGLTPKPNNGTVRLPLSPVGLHSSPDSGIEVPPDPDPAHTTTALASASSDNTPPSKALGVDPVTPTVPPIMSVSEDPTTALPEPSGHPNGLPDGNDGDSGSESSEPNKTEAGPSSVWDWITDKLDDWWRKITGQGSRDDDSTGD